MLGLDRGLLRRGRGDGNLIAETAAAQMRELSGLHQDDSHNPDPPIGRRGSLTGSETRGRRGSLTGSFRRRRSSLFETSGRRGSGFETSANPGLLAKLE